MILSLYWLRNMASVNFIRGRRCMLLHWCRCRKRCNDHCWTVTWLHGCRLLMLMLMAMAVTDRFVWALPRAPGAGGCGAGSRARMRAAAFPSAAPAPAKRVTWRASEQWLCRPQQLKRGTSFVTKHRSKRVGETLPWLPIFKCTVLQGYLFHRRRMETVLAAAKQERETMRLLSACHHMFTTLSEAMFNSHVAFCPRSWNQPKIRPTPKLRANHGDK